ncbi:ABC transporter substrate-binding protein [Streptomyces himalayensis]|uniref:Extracellular solute-binding protein n=1 Tax=Streptomyces himalayensis subsp. himalayensis TaxID=2756131 RepID=A0A7W0DMV0_9ACTN|nr:extracellular solute-binding protein [Streptomyces himalayensis]MBA2947993.1 extracellular solute-binding protein [Streptomyces himalayensis subsp. himalayensis]
MNNTGQLSRRSLLAAAAFAGLTTLVGCGSGDDSSDDPKDLSKKEVGAMKKYGVGDQFKATKPLTFSLLHLDNPVYPPKKSWLFWKELTKRTNVTFKTTGVPYSDYEKKRGLLIGAGDAPFLIPKTYPGQETAFVASGAILPVSEYVHLMPNFQEKVKKWGLEGDLDSIRQADGKYYLLPGIHEKVKVGYSLALRTDVLDEAGLELPTTWDEVHEVLKGLKEAHPKVYPFSDRWNQPEPGGALLNFLAQSFGTKGGWGYNNYYFDSKAQKYVFTGAMDEYRQMLEYLNKLVSDGLVDPESFTQSDDQAKQKLLGGKSFVISANPQVLADEYRLNLEKQVKGSSIAIIPVPVGPAGPVVAGSRLENGMMISSEALKSENFVAMMQFVDWLWYSDAGQELAKWGVKDVTYTSSGPGQYAPKDGIKVQAINPDAKKDMQKDYGFSNGVFAYGGNWSLVTSSFTEDEQEFQESMAQRKLLPVEPAHPLKASEQEQATLWETPLRDHVRQNTLKFALGKRPLSEWDNYVAELKAKNMEQFIDLHNKAYERFKQENG